MGPETLISMSAPDIDESDVEAFAEVLRSGRLALGPRAEEFEHRIAEYAGSPMPSPSAPELDTPVVWPHARMRWQRLFALRRW